MSETFFSIGVADMDRARAFYVAVFDAEVAYATELWTSLRIAGVRLGLAHDTNQAPTRTGLHFAVADLAAACGEIRQAGGDVVDERIEVVPGVVIAEVSDTEGNGLTLTLARGEPPSE